MKTPAERTAEYPEIRNEVWKIFEKWGYYPQEMAGPLSNMIVELCVVTSDKPMMDINRICKSMTADVRDIHKSIMEDMKKSAEKSQSDL